MNGTSEVVAKKYPKAMYFCGSVFSFTNFSYYGMKLVLLLFIANLRQKEVWGLVMGRLPPFWRPLWRFLICHQLSGDGSVTAFWVLNCA